MSRLKEPISALTLIPIPPGWGFFLLYSRRFGRYNKAKSAGIPAQGAHPMNPFVFHRP